MGDGGTVVVKAEDVRIVSEVAVGRVTVVEEKSDAPLTCRIGPCIAESIHSGREEGV